MTERIDVEGGKYTILVHDNGRLEALRYGEPWQDLTGNKMVFCLATELRDARAATLGASGAQSPAEGDALPEPFAYYADYEYENSSEREYNGLPGMSCGRKGSPLYTADQMRAYAASKAQPKGTAGSLTEKQIERAWRLGFRHACDAERLNSNEEWAYKGANVIEEVDGLAGRTNRGDETGGAVKRFGWAVAADGKHEIVPATNGAFVWYDDYLTLWKAQAPAPAHEPLTAEQAEEAADNLPCPGCHGTGTEMGWSDNSPDAHQVEHDCSMCAGGATYGAALRSTFQDLKTERERSRKHTDELHWLKSGPFFGLRADKSIQTVADRLDELADACGKYDPRSERASDIRAAATIWRKHLAGPSFPSSAVGAPEDVARARVIAANAQRFSDDRTHLGNLVYVNDLVWALGVLAAPQPVADEPANDELDSRLDGAPAAWREELHKAAVAVSGFGNYFAGAARAEPSCTNMHKFYRDCAASATAVVNVLMDMHDGAVSEPPVQPMGDANGS